MAGKSIDDILSKQAAQRQAQIQQQQAQERFLNEQREVQRQEYLLKMKNEKVSNFNPAAAAAAAGAAGGRVIQDNNENQYVVNDYVDDYFE
jgi:hypothetical protein